MSNTSMTPVVTTQFGSLDTCCDELAAPVSFGTAVLALEGALVVLDWLVCAVVALDDVELSSSPPRVGDESPRCRFESSPEFEPPCRRALP